MMVPACLLVMLCLLGIAVDGAAVRTAQRRLRTTCESVADDAAGVLDGHLLQRTGEVALDAPAAVRLAHRLLLTRGPGRTAVTATVVRADAGAGTVDLTVGATVDHLVLPSLPNGLGGTRVSVRCRGRLRT